MANGICAWHHSMPANGGDMGMPHLPEHVEHEVLRRSAPSAVKAVTALLPKKVFCAATGSSVGGCCARSQEGRGGW